VLHLRVFGASSAMEQVAARREARYPGDRVSFIS
jgi:hypothetical protein